jgi:polysaccharide biosynthesis/export protein
MREKIVKYLLISTIVFLILSSYCLFAQETAKEDYIIGEEDVLSISVWKEPELSMRELVVRPDGKISLPLVNDIMASGLTPKQLQEHITDKLKDAVVAPNVTVTVVRISSHTVSVVGQVTRPGILTLGSPTTVLTILARVGGLTEFAKSKSIKILRTENGKTLQFPFNYKNIINGKDLQQNILLKSGDTVIVP